jgi:hypothetical protein
VGILVRFAKVLHQPGTSSGRIILHRPCARIVDLLDNLGMTSYFAFAEEAAPSIGNAEQEMRCGEAVDKLEATRAALEAHQTLMELNPDNENRFKDVTSFMAEDLKRLEKERAARGS